MGVHLLSSSSQDSVQLEAWILVDVNVWVCSFFSDGNILIGWMNGDGSHSINICSMECSFLACDDIPNLIRIAGCEDKAVVSQPVEVVSFEGCQTIAIVESHGSSGQLWVLEGFLNVLLRIKLFFSHFKDIGIFLLLSFFLGTFFAFSWWLLSLCLGWGFFLLWLLGWWLLRHSNAILQSNLN